jgi:dienelactone hydrolase
VLEHVAEATHAPKRRAPDGELRSFARERFHDHGIARDFYRKGHGPAVLVLSELPGITPKVLGFADRVVALGSTVVLPDMFGTAGRDPNSGNKLADTFYSLRVLGQVCVRREFTALALGQASPIVGWLRALAAREHERCGGPGVGVVGMCFTGGFALAMAVDPRVLVPVLSQPSLPLPVSNRRRRAIDTSEEGLRVVASRCKAEGLRVLGLRFRGDPLVPDERFALLRERLGDGFVAIELEQSDGHPASPLRKHHSVLTACLIDEPGEATRAALDQVLALLRARLLVPASD